MQMLALHWWNSFPIKQNRIIAVISTKTNCRSQRQRKNNLRNGITIKIIRWANQNTYPRKVGIKTKIRIIK
jgi:hypothetical protein